MQFRKSGSSWILPFFKTKTEVLAKVFGTKLFFNAYLLPLKSLAAGVVPRNWPSFKSDMDPTVNPKFKIDSGSSQSNTALAKG